MIRKAVATDVQAIERYLAGYPETSMFLRNNLHLYGIDRSSAPHASQYWIDLKEGEICSVVGKSNNGYMMVQAPAATHAPNGFWSEVATLMQGLVVRGMTGVPAQVDAAFAALGLRDAAFLVNKDEPLYHIWLKDVKSGPVEMRLATLEDVDLLAQWFEGYTLDTGLTRSRTEAAQDAKVRANQAVNNPDVMVLIEDDLPVAMAGINARVADMVQIGGVYTPPATRGQGMARRAVAGLLARQKGIEQSILFAADEPAARAYEGIGYRQIGTYRVAMLTQAQTIGATL